jgi:hypothetical protein
MWTGSKFQLTKLRRVTLPIPRTSAHLSKHFEFPGLLDKNWINQLFNSQGIKFFRIDSEASEKLSTCPGSWTSLTTSSRQQLPGAHFFIIRTHALCPENPLRARSCHWPTFGHNLYEISILRLCSIGNDVTEYVGLSEPFYKDLIILKTKLSLNSYQ